MADLNLKLVISGSNDGAINALKQVVDRANMVGSAMSAADSKGTLTKTRICIDQISTGFQRIQAAAAGVAGGSFLVGLARDAIRVIDELKGVEARLKMSSRNAQEYQQMLVGVRDIAFQSGTGVAANVALATRIADPIKAFNGTQKDVLATTKAVNDALRIGNATTVEGAAVILQFAQAMAAGVLQGDELKSIMENSPRLAKAMADGLGVTTGALKEMGASGALTSQQIFKALQSQQGTLAEEAARLPITVGQAWTNAAEGVKKYISDIDKSTGASNSLAAALNSVAKNIPAIGDGIAAVAIGIAGAFGVRALSALSSLNKVTVDNREISASAARALAAEETRLAEAALVSAQAIRQAALADVEAAAAAKAMAGANEVATAAALERASAERLRSANVGVGAASGALDAAKKAEEAAAKTGLWARSVQGVRTALGGVSAFFGGPWGLALGGLLIGVELWDRFGRGAKKAADDARDAIDKARDELTQFGSNAGPAELKEQIGKAQAAAEAMREKLMSPAYRQSAEGQADLAKLQQLDTVIDKQNGRLKEQQADIKALVKEKGSLGLAGMKISAGGLISEESMKKLQNFASLYSEFTQQVKDDNGAIKVSAIETRAALDALFSGSKTSAEFSGLIANIDKAMKSEPNSIGLQTRMENAIEARAQAEAKSLNSLVSGLQARMARQQEIFSRAVSIALSQTTQAAALAKVAAELKNDVSGGSKIDAGIATTEVAAARASAAQQIDSIEQVAARKRALVDEEAAQIKAKANADIAAEEAVANKRLSDMAKEVLAGTKTAGQLSDLRSKLETDLKTKTESASAARGQAEADAARQIRQIDADTAQQRAAIAEQLYNTLKGKANEALSQYKQYAQQVQQLDKQIANNRLDTASAIMGLQRSNMDPKQQLESLREELAMVQQAAAEAQAAGKNDTSLEMLNRAKALAQQIGQQRGEGIDPAKQVEEGVAALSQIGAQADAILQQQRQAAQAAAQEQLNTYNQMTTAMNGLAAQITALNEKAAIKLSPEIDKPAVDAAIEAVKQAFASATFPVKVVPTGLPEGAATQPTVPGFADGGPIGGYSPHPRADNLLIWATAKEFMIRHASANQPGARQFLEDFNANGMTALKRWAPGYADGGLIGAASAIRNLQIPSLPRNIGQGGLPGMSGLVLDLGALGKHTVYAPAATQQSLTRQFKLAALQFGKKP